MFFLFQNKTVLTFNHGRHTARFNVGSKLKVGVYEKYFFKTFLTVLTVSHLELLCTTIRKSRNENNVGAEMRPAIVSGIVMGLWLCP